MPAKELYELFLLDQDTKESWVIFTETPEEATERGKRMVETQVKNGVNLMMLVIPLNELSKNVPSDWIGKSFRPSKTDENGNL